jgi:hypothetical protein
LESVKYGSRTTEAKVLLRERVLGVVKGIVAWQIKHELGYGKATWVVLKKGERAIEEQDDVDYSVYVRFVVLLSLDCAY